MGREGPVGATDQSRLVEFSGSVIQTSRAALAGQRGAALVFVLMVLTILAVAVFAFSDTSQLDATHARNFRDGARAFFLARAGVEHGMVLLEEDDNDFDTLQEEWAQDPQALELGDGRIEIRIQDEERKFNINLLALGAGEGAGARGEMIKRLFDQLGVGETFLPYLIDWIDDDQEEMPPGSEGAYYDALPHPYPVKNAPIEALSDLAAVAAAGEAIFEKFGVAGTQPGPRVDENQYLTVYSTGEVNINTAGTDVLMSLSSAITEGVAQEIVSYREARPFEKETDLRDLPVVRDIFGDIQEIITTLSTNFLIVATARVNGVERCIRAHVQRLDGEVSIQSWVVE